METSMFDSCEYKGPYLYMDAQGNRRPDEPERETHRVARESLSWICSDNRIRSAN